MKTLVYAKISKIINKLYNITRAYYFNIKKNSIAFKSIRKCVVQLLILFILNMR